MNWLAKPILASILKGVAVAWLLAFFPVLTPLAQANNWGEMAMVSATMGISDSRICIGEGSRGDLGCPSYAPTISPTGRLNASSGLTVDSVSLTTLGTTWGYLGSAASYLPRLNTLMVSATTVSTTIVQIASTTTVTTCNSGSMGSLRYNSTSASLELCNGTSWQSVGSGGGVGVPSGAIAAFASTTCPTGWSEYTAARGRFLRGIDNGAGNDPSGTRVPGSVQDDANRSHAHTGSTSSSGAHSHNITTNVASSAGLQQVARTNQGSSGNQIVMGTDAHGAHVHTLTIDANGAAEARPKNVAVIFCEYTGSGGSGGGSTSSTVVATTPAGSTGQIQYNTSGSFDASAGLTWDNAASRLTTVNISATALTVNGVAITGGAGASGDRITSGTTSAIANPAGSIDVSGSMRVDGTLQLMSATTAPVCSAATAGTIARINGKTYECRI